METLDRMLGATISRLQRNAAIGKRGTHQHDCAMVARQHALQRRHSAVYLTQISDLSHSPVIFGCHVDETHQCARKGGIDPDVDRSEVLLDMACRSEEHTSELQSLMRISYAVFCLKKKNNK